MILHRKKEHKRILAKLDLNVTFHIILYINTTTKKRKEL